ncbi:MAG: hypothetical protein EOO01_30480 [Chitinophagaceae bacterium]|nr:MAG: hypothetical protein EOO01_30480 [Chitinophagaceae bacterium]
MKTNFTNILLVRILLFVLICLYSVLVFGQDVAHHPAPVMATHHQQYLAEDELLSGTVINERVQLKWSLSSENSVNTVVIEKGYKTDAFKQHAIFWVNVDGVNPSEFRYADKQDAKKSVYYRLKMIDNNGTISYSNVYEVTGKKKK